MKLKDFFEVIRDSTRVQLNDVNGNHLTAPLHKRELTGQFDECEVQNVCTRYSGHGHTIRFYLDISIKV